MTQTLASLTRAGLSHAGKFLIVGMFFAGVLVLVENAAQAQGGVVNSTKNPQQIAILHWYKANRTAQFNVATGPAAFDGAHIWVINSNNVTKLRASDGASLGTFAVGDCPVGIAFDGANMWVTNCNPGTVTKLRARWQGTWDLLRPQRRGP